MTIIKFILISILRTSIHSLRLELVLRKWNFRLTLLSKRYRLNLLGINNRLDLLVINYWLSLRKLLNWNLLKLNRMWLLMISWLNLRIISWSNFPIRLLICLITRRRFSSLAWPPCNTNYLNFITNWWLLLTSSDDTEV